jgi:cysteine desulfurase
MSAPNGDGAAIAYLDHAATTPMRPEAVAAMLPFLTERFANPSGSHAASRDARRAVDEAREVVAGTLGCAPGEVVFTGCGTEADNLAVLGTIRRHGGQAVCPAAEHHAVLHAVEHLGGRVVAVDAAGAVDLDRLADALDPTVRVVSVMAVNNEVGSVSPLADVVALARERCPEALVHTDAIQGFQWLDLPEVVAGCDLVAVSGHKFGGPKGVGALVVRGRASVEPLLMGGGQERDRRSGTLNVAGIVAMAEAMRVTTASRPETVARVRSMRDRMVDGLVASVPGLVETVPRDRKTAGSAHVCIESVESESLLFLLDRAGVCASAASACSSGAMDPSHVLAAMGVPRPLADGALRLSFGWASTESDVDRVLDALPTAVRRLRRDVSVSP